MKITTVVAIVLLLFVCAAFAGRGPASGGLQIAGSSTILPLAEIVGEFYLKKYEDRLRIRGGGSSAGVAKVLSGEADIGLVSRALYDEERAGLDYATIGYDAVVIVVNSGNPIRDIRKDTLVALYTGRVRNWKEIGGADEPVVIVSKLPGRSTLEIFEEYTGLLHPSRAEKGGNGTISGTACEIGSNLESATLVGGLPGAVGYVSRGTALSLIDKGMPLKVLSLEGIEGTSENVMSGRYPVRRELNLVFKRKDRKVLRFIELFLGPEGQRVVMEQGFIPERGEGHHATVGKK